MQLNVAIRFENLSKTFGRGPKRVQAVKNLNLNIEGGQVYGFLGPNGAGKTTTIRLIMDLIHPTQGDVYVYGQHVRRQHAVLRNVGAIVEQAAFYQFLSAQRNLEILADTGNHDPKNIPVLLDQLSLTEHVKKRVGSYSTGMRQRLGLVAALLGDPKLLVLDEPTAGLDPAGMHGVRTFLRELVDEKEKTVFVSSHLLKEVEQFCDRVAIMDHGRIIALDTPEALINHHFDETAIEFEAIGEQPRQRLASLPGVNQTVFENGRPTLYSTDVPHTMAGLFELTSSGELAFKDMTVRQATLDDVFLKLTGRRIRG